MQPDLGELFGRGRRPGPLDHPAADLDLARPAVRQGQEELVLGRGVDERLGQARQPRSHRLLAARPELLAELRGDEVEPRVELTGVEVVVDGAGGLAVGDEPLGGPHVPRPLEVGTGHPELAPQELREQVVVAEPLALVVERDDEEVLGLDPAEQRAGVVPTGDVGAQVGPQALEHRRRQEELAHVVGLAQQDLVEQEVGHVPVAAGEPLDEPFGVVAAPQRQSRELQARRPSLGPLGQALDLVRRQVDLGEPLEELLGLAPAEAQVALPQLDELARQPEPVEPQRRVGPAADDEAQVGVGHGADEPVQQVGRAAPVDHVQVVEHHRGDGSLGQVPHRPDDGPVRPAVAGVVVERRLEHPGHELLERDEHRVEEVLGVGVPRVEREPGDGVGSGHRPLPHRDRLAGPCGAGDDDDPGAGTSEGGHQAVTTDEVAGEVR